MAPPFARHVSRTCRESRTWSSCAVRPTARTVASSSWHTAGCEAWPARPRLQGGEHG
ncbi:hypothetical protein [Saccharothrix yanglingensis]|uniref:hypothetical protein n=1 Tax=Saccharothrix yanglingensis TaxID=659496 RepID=UPI0027D30215|nr:hypothetical protein [Saccharothrix yanglingensis]